MCGDLATSILPFYSQKLNLLYRSLELTPFYGKNGFCQDLDYFPPFLKNFFRSIAQHNNVINVLQVFWSLPLFQCILDQSLADGRAVVSTPGAVGSKCTGRPSK